jgi:hypothetical protein
MKDKIQVFDDVVPKQLSDTALHTFSSDSFTWFWNNATVDPRLKDFPQLVHPFRLNTMQEYPHLDMFDQFRRRAFDTVKGIFERGTEAAGLDAGTIDRIKANLTWPNRVKMGAAHTDMAPDYYYSMIYYINDADGDTVFFSQGDSPENEIARVSPKKGRLVVFPSNISHAGECPTHTLRRMVVNYVFTVL